MTAPVLPTPIIDLLRLMLTSRISADGLVRIVLPSALVVQAAIAAGLRGQPGMNGADLPKPRCKADFLAPGFGGDLGWPNPPSLLAALVADEAIPEGGH